MLLKQYLKLGGKLLAFNVDQQFSNALDGLIVVDLVKTDPRLLDRYMGRAGAAEFLSTTRNGLPRFTERINERPRLNPAVLPSR